MANNNERLKERVKKVAPVFVSSVAREAAGGGSSLKAEVARPGDCVLALEMLANGFGAEKVREKTGLGWEAISGLRARHEMALDVRRKQLATDGFELAEGIRLLAKKKMEMLAEDDEALSKTSLRDLILSNAIAQDKAFAAMGEKPVSVVEHRSGRPSLADAQAAIAEARASLQKEAVEVVAVEVK
jgi:hypothetical protein